MENYIITNKTIALLKQNNKTIIYDVDKVRIINTNILKILKLNSDFYGNNLNISKNNIKKLLNISYKIPIILNNNIILLQLNNLRNNNCLFINYNKILNYNIINNNLEIICVNKKFYIKISKNSFEKILLNGIKLNNIINYKKNINFV